MNIKKSLMNKPTLSIIIPAYNAAQFLPKLISSIPETELVEIIVVNDGSKDNTSRVCEELQLSHTNIKIINQRNAGVSAARNRGIKEAAGEWLLFADADDWFDQDSLNNLVEKFESVVDAEMVTFGVIFHNPKDKIEKRVQDCIYSSVEFVRSVCLFQHASWIYAFRRDIVLNNQIEFPTFIRNTEDQNFNMKYLACVKKVNSINLLVYNYNRLNVTSASSCTRKEDWVKAPIISINDVLCFYKQKGKDTSLLIEQTGRMYDDFMRDLSSPMTLTERGRFFREQYKKTCMLLPSFAKIKKYRLCNCSMFLGVLAFWIHKKLKG